MGRDKADLVLAGRSLLEHAAANLSPLVERVWVVGRSSAAPGLEVLDDVYPGLGPLAGIHAALSKAEAACVLVLACDLPFATSDFLRGLVERLGPRDDAVVPCSASGPVPVCAVYRSECAAAIEKRLEARVLSARSFVASIRARLVEGAELAKLDPGGRALINVNSPEDFARASTLAKG